MSTALDDLLLYIRQHPAFRELLAAVDAPAAKDYRPSDNPEGQFADYIFRSGARRQHEAWRQYLIGDNREPS